MKKQIGRRVLLQILLALSVCLFCGCGGEFRNKKMEKREEKPAHTEEQLQKENDSSVNDLQEDHTAEEDFSEKNVPSYFPENDSITKSIYSYYGRMEDEKISEEEVLAAKGKLPGFSLTVHSGEEFALMREWYDWDRVNLVRVYFSKELKEWQEEDLQALEILDDIVYVESDDTTLPARVLAYLTGAREVNFGVSDVTGTLPDGTHFPKQIKDVTLNRYQEGNCSTILNILQDSQIETLTVGTEYGMEESQSFWLDDVARISTLKELALENIMIRVREEAALDGCSLTRITGHIDRDTDLCFVEKLSQLEEVKSNILAERDLSPLLQRKGLSLYLDFCRDTTEDEKEAYGTRTYTVCPAFNRAVLWPGEAGDEKFLGRYQRRENNGRVAECFTERGIIREEDEVNMYDFDAWIRVTDGLASYEFRPAEEMGGDCGFGEARSDRMSFEDINFDGVKDIVLDAGGFGNQMLRREYVWLWDRESGRYEFFPAYYEIENPTVDAKHQLVRSSCRNWAASHSWAIYRYVDGELVMQGRLTEEFLFDDRVPPQLEMPEGVGVWCWTEEIFENGEVTEVKTSYAADAAGEESIYPEALEAYYAEDSYWGNNN